MTFHFPQVARDPLKRRKRLSLKEKSEAARCLQNGASASSVMKRFGIGRSTITKIKSNLSVLIQKAHAHGASLHAKSLRTPPLLELEEEVLTFINIARSARMPVTKAVIRQRAFSRDRLLEQKRETEISQYLKSFTASTGWAQNFVRRHALRSIALHGAGGSVNASEVASAIANLRAQLREYDTDCIYNVDETGLFFKLLPRRTYICSYENKKSIRGTKSMKSKDRVTAFVCTNACGSEKLPMAIIGKSQKPRCFRNQQPPVPYFSRRNAWADGVTFRRWFWEIFMPHVRGKTNKKVALVMDNCGPHGSDVGDPNGQVDIYLMPPNCTALHQPMDMGIISAWKRKYKSLMLTEIARNLENRTELRAQAHQLRAGMRGMSHGYDPNMLDVAEMVHHSWKSVSEMTIARCWAKSNILLLDKAAFINSTFGRMRNTSSEDDVQAILVAMKRITLEVQPCDSLSDETRSDVSEADARRWIDIETDVDIQEAIVCDALDEVQAEGDSVETDATVEEVNDEARNNGEERAIMPTSVGLNALLLPLEKLADDCNVSEVGMLLRRVRSLFART